MIVNLPLYRAAAFPEQTAFPHALPVFSFGATQLIELNKGRGR
ncbi:MAG: hypothetical protein ACXWVF_00325 [Telluria sp.]